MTPTLSLYLDAVRFLAALSVVMNHLWKVVYPSLPLPWPGHEAVVVFFVLSGYVISYSARRPEETAKTYAISRSARILSVAWPSLMLCVVIAPFFTNPLLDEDPVWRSGADFARRVALNAVFMAERWHPSAWAPLNNPYWSLNFEVWYYALFGCAFYLRGVRRALAVCICVVLAGPKVLLLMPSWLMGVAIQRWPIALSRNVARGVFIASVVLALAFFQFDVSRQLRSAAHGYVPSFIGALGPANQFIGDAILGLLVAANFLAVRSFDPVPRVKAWLQGAIRTAASYTLSVYLFHMPIASLLWSGLAIREPLLFWPLLGLGIVGLGRLTEHQVGPLRRWMAGSTVAVKRSSTES